MVIRPAWQRGSKKQIMLAVKLQSNLAMILAGLALQHSWGVVQDRELGFRYYAKAAKQICRQASLTDLHPNNLQNLSEALKQELCLEKFVVKSASIP
jgi:TPR repeat protein